jgi:hypothetical protein
MNVEERINTITLLLESRGYEGQSVGESKVYVYSELGRAYAFKPHHEVIGWANTQNRSERTLGIEAPLDLGKKALDKYNGRELKLREIKSRDVSRRGRQIMGKTEERASNRYIMRIWEKAEMSLTKQRVVHL